MSKKITKNTRSNTFRVAVAAALAAFAMAPAAAQATFSSNDHWSRVQQVAGMDIQFVASPAGREYAACVMDAATIGGLSMDDAVFACPDLADAAIMFNGRASGLTHDVVRPLVRQARRYFYREATRHFAKMGG